MTKVINFFRWTSLVLLFLFLHFHLFFNLLLHFYSARPFLSFRNLIIFYNHLNNKFYFVITTEKIFYTFFTIINFISREKNLQQTTFSSSHNIHFVFIFFLYFFLLFVFSFITKVLQNFRLIFFFRFV